MMDIAKASRKIDSLARDPAEWAHIVTIKGLLFVYTVQLFCR